MFLVYRYIWLAKRLSRVWSNCLVWFGGYVSSDLRVFPAKEYFRYYPDNLVCFSYREAIPHVTVLGEAKLKNPIVAFISLWIWLFFISLWCNRDGFFLLRCSNYTHWLHSLFPSCISLPKCNQECHPYKNYLTEWWNTTKVWYKKRYIFPRNNIVRQLV